MLQGVGSCKVQLSCEVRCCTLSQPDKICTCVWVCVYLAEGYSQEDIILHGAVVTQAQSSCQCNRHQTSTWSVATLLRMIINCPIAITCSIGQIIKLCICV